MFEKKILSPDIKPGMFVAGLDRPWIDTPFLLQGFLVETDEDVTELRRLCRYVTIDLARSSGNGLELEYAMALKAAKGVEEQRVIERADPNQIRYNVDVKDAKSAGKAAKADPTKEGPISIGSRAKAQPVARAAKTGPEQLSWNTGEMLPAETALLDAKTATDTRATKRPTPTRGKPDGGRVGSRFGWMNTVMDWFGRPGIPDFDDIDLDQPDSARFSSGPIVVYRETETLRAEMPRARRAIDRSETVVRDVMKTVEANGGLQIEKAEDVMQELIDSMARNPNAALWLSRMRAERETAFSQSLQTAIYMVALGMHIGLGREDVTNLSVAGLMLDIGKLRVPKELLDRSGKLAPAEFEAVKRHVSFSLDILAENPAVHPKVVEAVARHHEREDGSGYPHGLRGDSIGLYGRIAGIVDTFTAMTNVRSYADTLSMHDALRSLYKWRGTQFQEPLIEQFVQAIGVFPVGSMVELSSGDVAIVISHNRVRRIKPRVLLLTGPDKTRLSKPTPLDLLYAPAQPNGEELCIASALPAGSYGIDPREFFVQ